MNLPLGREILGQEEDAAQEAAPYGPEPSGRLIRFLLNHCERGMNFHDGPLLTADIAIELLHAA